MPVVIEMEHQILNLMDMLSDS